MISVTQAQAYRDLVEEEWSKARTDASPERDLKRPKFVEGLVSAFSAILGVIDYSGYTQREKDSYIQEDYYSLARSYGNALNSPSGTWGTQCMAKLEGRVVAYRIVLDTEPIETDFDMSFLGLPAREVANVG